MGTPYPPVTVSDHRPQVQGEQEAGREEDPQLLSLLPGEPELNIWVQSSSFERFHPSYPEVSPAGCVHWKGWMLVSLIPTAWMPFLSWAK